MIFDSFDRIRIISLPERADRQRQMRRQLAAVGLDNDPRVEFFDACRVTDPGMFRGNGERGCFISHSIIISQAAAASQSVLILEDDCDFLPEAKAYEAIGPWDVFYGGYLAQSPNDLENSDIIGSHFMGLNVTAAKKASTYFARYQDPDFPPDRRSAAESGFDPAIRPGADGAYVWFRRAHPELRTEFALLSKQRSSRTDIGELRWFDRTLGVRNLVELARTLKNI